MSKAEQIVILPAAHDGWEIWAQRGDTVQHVKSLPEVLTKSDAPAGSCVAFPITQVIALPIVVPSSDAELCRGSAQLELEKSGLLENSEESTAWDHYTVAPVANESIVAALLLLEDQLDPANEFSHYTFDLSSRFFLPSSQSDCVTIYKQCHTWCLTFYRNKIPLISEPLGEDLTDAASAIRLLCDQIEVRGITFIPTEVIIWSDDEDFILFNNLKQELVPLNVLLSQEPQPKPRFPSTPLTYQPHSVTEWEQRVNARKRVKLAILTIAALYFIAGGYLWWQIQQIDQKIDGYENEVVKHAPTWLDNQNHLSDWDEISPIVEPNWPLRLYKECVNAIPSGQPIRFTEINLQHGFIQIKGNAVRPDALNKFKPKLRKSRIFDEYQWQLGQAKQSNKTKLWEFQYNAKPIGIEGDQS